MNPGLLTMATRAIEVPAEQLETGLVSAAANFLGAGGVVSLSEWAAMPSEERRALHHAAQIIALERAQSIAREILRAQLDPASLLGPVAPDEKRAPAGATA